MTLQSKFGYCIITQTLNIALFLKAAQNYGRTHRRTDRQTDKLTDDPITRYPPADLSGRGHKTLHAKPGGFFSLYAKLQHPTKGLQIGRFYVSCFYFIHT